MSKFDKVSDLILLKAKTGKCQIYSEYETKPVFFKNFFEKNLDIGIDLLLKKIIKLVPKTTIAEKIDGLGMFSLKKIIDNKIILRPKITNKLFFFLKLSLALECKYAIKEPHKSSHKRVGKM